MVHRPAMTTTDRTDLLVITASNGENLKLAQRFTAQARCLGHSADVLDLTTVELPVFTPRAQEQGEPKAIAPLEHQLLSNHAKPPKDDSIQDLLHRLLQMEPLQL